MGRHGENIRKRGDGRWEARYTVYDADKGTRVLKSVYGHTYEEAKQNRLVLISQFQNPSDKADSREKGQILQNMLFRTVAEEWLETVKSRQKASTYEKYRIVYHTHLEDAIGMTAIGDITDRFAGEKISGSLSDSLLKSSYCVLNRILKYASLRYAVALPCIQRPASEAGRKTIKVFTKTEQARLLSTACCQMDLFKMAVLLCLFTGLRLGELCALKRSDIDLENKTLSVKRTVQRLCVEEGRTKTVLVEIEPKSIRSEREIPLQDATIKMLLHFKNGKEYIFGGNKPLDPRTMQNRYKQVLEEAGVTYKNFHTLRHTYATNSIESGADVKSLSDMLGHSNVQITLNYYVHPSMDTKRRCAERLCDYYMEVHGQILGREN